MESRNDLQYFPDPHLPTDPRTQPTIIPNEVMDKGWPMLFTERSSRSLEIDMSNTGRVLGMRRNPGGPGSQPGPVDPGSKPGPQISCPRIWGFPAACTTLKGFP